MSNRPKETSEVPTFSRAAVFHRANAPLELIQIPIPELNAGELLVEISSSTICGSDLHTSAGRRTEPAPSILGHESVGRVIQLGSKELTTFDGHLLSVGDRITWSVCVSCGTCDRCLAGLPQKCRSVFKYGHREAKGRFALSGGFAEYILLQKNTALFHVPEFIPDEVICPANCATATVASAFRAAGDVKNRRVIILGAGMLGLTATAFAHKLKAASITVCDVNSDRLTLVESFGASETINLKDNIQRDRLNQYDVVLEFSGALEAVQTAYDVAETGGTIVLVGSTMPSQSLAVNPEQIIRRCLSIHGVHNYAPQDLLNAINFLAETYSAYPFQNLVQSRFSLAEINDAFEYAENQQPVRVAVCPSRSDG